MLCVCVCGGATHFSLGVLLGCETTQCVSYRTGSERSHLVAIARTLHLCGRRVPGLMNITGPSLWTV